MKLGIIGCPHGKAKAVKQIVARFRKEKVDGIVLTGDLGSDSDSISRVLRAVRSSKPVFVIPGSHEPVADYKAAVKKFDVIDCTLSRNRMRKLGDYKLVFLPGSDWRAPTGEFMLLEDRRHMPKQKLPLKFFFINELPKLVRNPERTILVAHVPPRFYKKSAIDFARFGRLKRAFALKIAHLEKYPELFEVVGADPKTTVFRAEIAKKLIRLGYPAEIVQQNCGNKALRRWIEKIGIKKMVCSHIHEAGQRGCDLRGNLVPQGKWSKELFYNPGPAEQGKAGILLLKGTSACYENIKINV